MVTVSPIPCFIPIRVFLFRLLGGFHFSNGTFVSTCFVNYRNMDFKGTYISINIANLLARKQQLCNLHLKMFVCSSSRNLNVTFTNFKYFNVHLTFSEPFDFCSIFTQSQSIIQSYVYNCG